MAALQLNLTKPGQERPKLSLNLAKPARFTVELAWDSVHDLDGHALLATNNGAGAKITSLEQILSTYNCARANNAQGALPGNPDGSFFTPEKALTHSGDQRTGIGKDIDEVITVNGALVPAGVNEIPIFVTIHPSATAKFGQVNKASITIRDDSGKVLAQYELSQEFAEFDAVQMGSLLLTNNGWEFAAAGSGFNGDFNQIIGFFS